MQFILVGILAVAGWFIGGNVGAWVDIVAKAPASVYAPPSGGSVPSPSPSVTDTSGRPPKSTGAAAVAPAVVVTPAVAPTAVAPVVASCP